MNAIETTHNLDFEWSEYPNFFEGEDWLQYKVGTVKGLWNSDDENYIILSFVNHEKGNGHLQDVFEWFENSCKRDNKNLVIKEIVNPFFYKHLTEKRGFVPLSENPEDQNNLIKYINQ
jgi:hypothetical protein